MSLRLLPLLCLLVSCAQGGAESSASARSDEAPAAGAREKGQLDLLIDPIAEQLEPLGLGYRVVTTTGEDEQESFGLDLAPLLIDVDRNLGTGLLGADISVQVFATALAYQLEVRLLPNATSLPLRIEVEFGDPLAMLVGGDPAQRIVMGYDALQGQTPELFREAVVLADLQDALLLGVQSASLDIEIQGGGGHLSALGGTFTKAAEGRQDELAIDLGMTPPAQRLQFGALFGGRLQGGQYRISSATKTLLEITMRDGDLAAGGQQQFVQLDSLDGAIQLSMDESAGLNLDFSADNGAEVLLWESSGPDESVVASLAPLPLNLTACMASDDSCGSHHGGTASSMSLHASESIELNYDSQRSGKRILVESLRVQHLDVDFGASGSFRKGYVFFNTDDAPFSGRVLQDRSSSGFDLAFPVGTHAQDRLMTWKNYVQTDRREGSMECPGGASLEIKADGRFYDADFVIDKLC